MDWQKKDNPNFAGINASTPGKGVLCRQLFPAEITFPAFKRSTNTC